MRERITAYYQLTKPGIVYGNLLVAVAALLFASDRQVDLFLLLALAAGMGTVIASACVVNNYIDRDIDARMDRTKKRALVSGSIGTVSALAYATILGCFGFGMLIAFTPALTVVLGVVAYASYTIIYGIAKRTTVYSTLIGGIPGALPPVAGYVAVTGQIDTMAWLLFIAMFVWQLAHFYAIGLFRLDDYKRARLPILPARLGSRAVKLHIMIYIALYGILVLMPSYLGYTSWWYIVVMSAVSVWWFVRAARSDSERIVLWARGVFFDSLKVLLVYALMLSVDAWLP